MENKKSFGHLSAIITIVIWGTTFISTKILLIDFQPVEILFFRFAMGFLALLIVCPYRLSGVSRKQEATFIAAGLCGICLYYLRVKPYGRYIGGCRCFCVGMLFYINKKISSYGYSVFLTTRRTFFYGILFMIPNLFFFDFKMDLSRFTNITYLLNILYLGLGASALCFVTWNFAVKILGAVKTSIYIYMVPVITTVTSVLILKEPVTWISALGTLLTVIGLFLSEYNKNDERRI